MRNEYQEMGKTAFTAAAATAPKELGSLWAGNKTYSGQNKHL